MATSQLDGSKDGATATRCVALVGNPNTGKTTLFNALSGLRQRVGNYPGVTVETKKGSMLCDGVPFQIIDLPGTYSLAPRSPDEMVAVDVLLGNQEGEVRPDVIVSIVDASNLERNLFLTTQTMELGVPVVLALNMLDVAEAQGINIDAQQLSERLGIPVVPIQANKNKNLDQLRSAILEASNTEPPKKGCVEFPEAFEKEVDSIQEHLGEDSHYLARRLLLDSGGYTEQRFTQRQGSDFADQLADARNRAQEAGCPIPGVEARSRYSWIRQSLAPCVQRPETRPVTWTDRIDKILTHKLWGTLVFLGVMFLVFEAIFFAATPLMEWIDAANGALADWLRPTSGLLPAGPLADLIVDGIIVGVGSVIIFLPQILILFGLIAILEDCGYMARAAFLMDKLMSRCGLSGKSFIPLLSSVACAVPGIMATRVIEDRRDRLATMLVAPLMSCSARLPVYILLIGAFLPIATDSNPNGYSWYVPGLAMFSLYALGLVVAPLVALALKRTLLKGDTPLFLMEMPLYKWPSLRTIGGRMFDSAWAFIRRAGTIIFFSMIVIWALLYFPRGVSDSRKQQLEATTQNEIVSLRETIAVSDPDKRAPLQATLAKKEERLELLKSGNAVYPELVRSLEAEAEILEEAKLEERAETFQGRIRETKNEWVTQTWLGQLGHWIEPAVRPLGWDWKIGTAALASFPAREVVLGTLAILYSVEEAEFEDRGEAADTQLAQALQRARWADAPDRPVFTVPVALSLLVFFALCCQCVSTLAVIRRESGTWRWPIFTFVYMTVLAYVGALLVFQIGQLFV